MDEEHQDTPPGMHPFGVTAAEPFYDHLYVTMTLGVWTLRGLLHPERTPAERAQLRFKLANTVSCGRDYLPNLLLLCLF